MLELGIKIDEWHLLNVWLFVSPWFASLFRLGWTSKLSSWTVESDIKRIEQLNSAVGNVQEAQLHGNVAVATCCCFSARSNDHPHPSSSPSVHAATTV